MRANQCQITLGSTGLEITREPVSGNAPEILKREFISGVIPVFQATTVGYRFKVMTVIRIYIRDENPLDIELQEVTNQMTWSTGDLDGLKRAIDDINGLLLVEAAFLDRFPGNISVAHSMNRRLTDNYLGPAFRIRRSNDDAVLDIHFLASGAVDLISIYSFVGPFDAVCDIIYDQSGNANHLIQTTPASMPFVVVAGAMIIDNGNLGIRSGSGSTTMLLTNTLNIASNFTSLMVSTRSAVATLGMHYGSLGGNIFSAFHYSDDNVYTRGDSGYIVSNAVDTNPFQELLVGVFNGTTKTQQKNGVAIASTFNAAVSADVFEHLSGSNNDLFFEGMIYSSNKTSTIAAMQADIMSHYNIMTPSESGTLLDEDGTDILDEDGTSILNG